MWPPKFFDEKYDILFEDLFYVTSWFSLTALKILSLVFKSLIIIYLGVGLLNSSYLKFIELLSVLMSVLSNLENFQALFLQICSLPISLFFFWDSSNVHFGLFDGLPLSHRLHLLFFDLSLSVPQFHIFRSTYSFFILQVYLFLLLPAQISWTPIVNFSFQLLDFSAPGFYFCFAHLNFLFLLISPFFLHCFFYFFSYLCILRQFFKGLCLIDQLSFLYQRQRQLLLFYFFLWVGWSFCFFICLMIFGWN